MTAHLEALRDHACLIVHGPDQPGIVAAVTALITRNQGNIVTLDQYSDDPESGEFFQRVKPCRCSGHLDHAVPMTGRPFFPKLDVFPHTPGMRK